MISSSVWSTSRDTRQHDHRHVVVAFVEPHLLEHFESRPLIRQPKVENDRIDGRRLSTASSQSPDRWPAARRSRRARKTARECTASSARPRRRGPCAGAGASGSGSCLPRGATSIPQYAVALSHFVCRSFRVARSCTGLACAVLEQGSCTVVSGTLPLRR